MSTNLEYGARERQTKRGGRPAKLSEKKGDRDLKREIKNTKETFFCWKNNKNFVAALTKCDPPQEFDAKGECTTRLA